MRNLWIGMAGFAGGVARYQVQLHIGRDRGAFPWATFIVNVTGCFLVGVASTVLVRRLGFPPDLRAAVTVGFLGAYTTFSTFATRHCVWRGARRCRWWRSSTWLPPSWSGWSAPDWAWWWGGCLCDAAPNR